MKYLLKSEDIHKGSLILVNKNYPIKNEIQISELETFNDKYSDIKLEKNTNKYLQLTLKEINSLDKIVPVSGYRTYQEQVEIYNSSLKDNGVEFTKKYVALPNSSEHQTGLAIDLGLNIGEIDFIRPSFPHNNICENFRNVSVYFGFIERYKDDKTDITNISSEEWHFRFVGYPHSIIMKEKNLCLEEYIEYLKQYENKPLNYKNYEIYYIPYKNKDIKIILSEKDKVSGNNIDGFIITRNNL